MNKRNYDDETLEAVLGFLAQADMAGRTVEPTEELLANGVLDSLKILNLVAFAEQRLGQKIDADQVLPENFGSPMNVAVFLASSQRTKPQ